MTTNRVAIVDPFSAGALLAEALLAHGASCIAIVSACGLPASMRSRFNQRLFSKVIQHSGDLPATIASLAEMGPSHIVAGCESGVELAEQLAESLGMAGNGTAQRDARRDKYLMAEVVRACGLRVSQQFRARKIGHIVERVREGFDFPVIVKPTRSTASDLVFRCDSIDAVSDGARKILSRRNILGQRNEAVLVQEFLDGVEYAVDTVSLGRERKVTAFWRYHRPDSPDRFVAYDAMTLLPYEGVKQEALKAYALDVLDALSIRFGPAHCELMWVCDEPVLIEVGTRLSGGINAVLSGLCGGLSQLEETVKVILNPDEFRNSICERPFLEKRAAHVFLMSPGEGRVRAVKGLDTIAQLPTLHSMSVSAKPGDVLRKVAGTVVLIDKDLGSIERDIDVIRAAERAGLFELELPA